MCPRSVGFNCIVSTFDIRPLLHNFCECRLILRDSWWTMRKKFPQVENLKLLADLDKRKFIPCRRNVVQDEYKEMTVAQLIFRAGGPKRFNFPKPRWVARALTELPLHIYQFSCCCFTGGVRLPYIPVMLFSQTNLFLKYTGKWKLAI